MSTDQSHLDSPSRSWSGHKPGLPVRGTQRRRRVPYLVTGVLLVLACAGGTALTVLRLGDRHPVLALAHPVAVGHVLTAQDLHPDSVAADAGTDLVAASDVPAVLGQPAAYSLPAGTLLTHAAVGPAQLPPPGQAVVAVAAKPGQFPPDLAAGVTVSVIAVPGSAPSAVGLPAPSGGPWQAVVTSVAPPGGDQATVISLELPAISARQVASVPPGQLSLVALSPGGAS